MPSTALYTFTGKKLESQIRPDLSPTIAVKLPVSSTFTLGTILGEITATPGTFNTFDPNAADGTQIAKCILQYTVTTDADGLATISGAFPAFPERSVPAYVGGYFDCATIDTAMGDAGTLLAAAISSGFGKLVEGTAAAGTVAI